MNCPHCGAGGAEQTDLFDMSQINWRECWHDFQCGECDGLFQIGYQAAWVKKVKSNEEE